MKSTDFIIESQQKGTYAGVHFSESTKKAIEKYIKDNNIPNGVPKDKLHTTVLYSRKYCPDYVPCGKINPPLKGTPKDFDVWPAQDGNNCLVLEFVCPALVARHNELMKEHQATHDFPEYKTHLTLSYNLGDVDIHDLPPFTAPIEIIEEYGEDLDLNWAQRNASS